MYQNPYLMNNSFMPQAQMPNYMPRSQQTVVKVNGRNGAEMYQMPPNSSALLLDETAPIIWLAQTDGAGYKSISAYDIHPHEEEPPINMKDIDERLKKVEEMINAKPDTTGDQHKVFTTEQYKPSAKYGGYGKERTEPTGDDGRHY